MLSGVIGKKIVYSAQDIKFQMEAKANLVKNQINLIQDYKKNKKTEYNSVIPLKIYQTWHSKELPEKMKLAVDRMKLRHPRFEHFLFDDDDCRNFIADNFDGNVLNAFDNIIPGAYKADLWRYCVLYINGGIYLDIKYNCINTFRFIELTEKEHWVFDIGRHNIYNALIAVKPKNDICFKCINQIVANVNNKYYGGSCVDPTGPGLVARIIGEKERREIELEHIHNASSGDKFILYKNVAILKMYNDYYGEQDRNKKILHYSTLWNHRRIYK
jgi:mannosyltransferase OCH1-like enzyme